MPTFSCDLSEWSQFFHDARNRVHSLLPVHTKIGEYLVPEVQENFETNGGRENWRRLAPATLTKERLAYGDRPLVRTKGLLHSITYDAREGWVDIGSRVPYARALFFGFAPGRLPARSPFKFYPRVLEPIADMFIRFILGVTVH